MLSFHVSGSPRFVFLNPLSLAADDCRSVLAVKGSLRRFAPWTAAGRSGRRGCLRGKGDVPASAGPDQRVRTRPSSTSASCTNEWFRNDPTPNWFSRAWGLRNGIAGEIQLAIVFCNAVREAVIQALRREGTPHHHHPARDAKHN